MLCYLPSCPNISVHGTGCYWKCSEAWLPQQAKPLIDICCVYGQYPWSEIYNISKITGSVRKCLQYVGQCLVNLPRVVKRAQVKLKLKLGGFWFVFSVLCHCRVGSSSKTVSAPCVSTRFLSLRSLQCISKTDMGALMALSLRLCCSWNLQIQNHLGWKRP